MMADGERHICGSCNEIHLVPRVIQKVTRNKDIERFQRQNDREQQAFYCDVQRDLTFFCILHEQRTANAGSKRQSDVIMQT